MTAPGRDRVLLITGASSGIGAATARAAVAAGWRLVLLARSREKLEALAAELGPDRVLVRRCDVTVWSDQESAVAAALERFGQLDAAWANAGHGATSSFFADDVDWWRSMVLTNVYGTALTIRATGPALRQSAGHLLVTGSDAGRAHVAGSLYSATKHAVHAMAESARLEFQGTGVRVTVVAPGMVATPFFEVAPFDYMLKRPLVADDVAAAVLYALSQPPHVDVSEILLRPTDQRSE
jgi:NADP-dependent 3-hydroxy acid dehydrogenase YdfG